MAFVPLHVHTQYSVLDGLSNIEKLFQRAEELGMPALAITDHGNMYGVKEFYNVAKKYPRIKPIFGCEMYITRHYDHTLKDTQHNKYYHLILLAKNETGYHNLMKLVSFGHINDFYYRPRIDHELLEKYHEGLICTSACIAGEIPQKILAGDIEGAEKAIEWHKGVFGDDYYLEVMLHKSEVPGLAPAVQATMNDLYSRQKIYTEKIFELAAKHNVKVIATNDTHFVRKEDGPVHDRLICLTTNADVNDPMRGAEGSRGLRYTQQEYLKSEEEMYKLFPTHPEAVANTQEIMEKVENIEINRSHVLPKFDLPEDFLKEIDTYLEKYKEVIDEGRFEEHRNGDGAVIDRTPRSNDFCHSVAYLCHLSYLGAEKRYGKNLSEDILERIDFELKTISRMGFPDYFLIVQDFINWAKNNDISVGPGRGSAAGSCVAYCLRITNLDPLKYGLLFERFLNPERVSMPDIDVDFDDEGRYRVIQYVQNRYGKDHISHVITFGTMGAKGSLKDVARISGLPLAESERLSKMIPEKVNFLNVKENGVDVEKPLTLANCVKYLPDLKKEYESGDPLVKEVLEYAIRLEGTIRQTGIHASAMIIGRGNLTDYIPITLGTDKATGQEVWVSQYEGNLIEDVGMLKMDFLGIKTLSIIERCLKLIKKRFGKDIDMETIPLDDSKVYELYGRGETISVFQFESPGMREWLMRLRPQRFEDLIAMNALYRPGPMEYIPDFVERKNDSGKICYDLPEMEKMLQETYGVTVYQEQVMRISQMIAGFSQGKADQLRKAMGKKKREVLDGLKADFMEGALSKGYKQSILEKIWSDWEAFAKYAFNKSHAACYALVSYQTAWLKTHYPSEFQASNLTQQTSDMDEMVKIMADCKRFGIKVLSPDVNESDRDFSVNRDGNIRFGLSGLKGFGSNIVDAIIAERDAGGPFADVFDFIERLGGIVNRRAMETLVCAGAFDSFGYKRSSFFLPSKSGEEFIEELVKYGDLYKNDTFSAAGSLFGDVEELKPQRPEMPLFVGEEDVMSLLQKEKEFVGMYLSAHPLNRYAFEIATFTNCKLKDLKGLIDEANRKNQGSRVKIAGIVMDVKKFTTKNGRPGVEITIEDYSGSYKISLYGKDCEDFLPYMGEHSQLFIDGEIARQYRPKREHIEAGKIIPYVFKIKKVKLLGNVGEEMIKNFAINIDTASLSPAFRKKLLKLLKDYSGPTRLCVNLFDKGTGYRIEMASNKYNISVCEDFLIALEHIGISYLVTTK